MLAAAKSFRDSLARTRQSAFGRIATFLGQSEITEETWDELEAMLIQADVGVGLTQTILTKLKERVKAEGLIRAEQLKAALRAELRALLGEAHPLNLTASPTVLVLVGVNGSGKTTTAAKI